MARRFSESITNIAEEIARREMAMVEAMAAAYAEDTGFAPLLVEQDGRTWCDSPSCYRGTDLMSTADIKARATYYRVQTDIPAAKAALVREFRDLSVTWRWEERK